MRGGEVPGGSSHAAVHTVCFPQELSLKCPLVQIQQGEGQVSKKDAFNCRAN